MDEHKTTGTTTPALTRQRAAVLQVIRDTREHMTAAEIFEAARRALPGLSYATVYDPLRFLKEAGLVPRSTLETARAALCQAQWRPGQETIKV